MMRGGQIARAIDCAAAALFAAAAAFCGWAVAGGGLAALVAPVAFGLAFAGLTRIEAERLYPVAHFELGTIDPPQCADDAIDDGRVVRLFDPRQLAIARPSGISADNGVPPDASQALSDALAELKRALR